MMYFIGFQNTIVTTADDSTAAIVFLAIDRRSPDIPMATQQPVVKQAVAHQAVAILSEGNVGVRLRLPLTIDQGGEERRPGGRTPWSASPPHWTPVWPEPGHPVGRGP